jgi:AcrR family transcriptional regulator
VGLVLKQHPVGDDVRTNIVNTALRLFGQRGYHATSIQEIIGEAGCSKGAFYHYFDAKEDLVLLFHDTFIDHLVDYAERIHVESGQPLEKLQRICTHLLESMSTFRNHMAVFNHESRFLTQKKFAIVKAKRDRYETAVRSLVQEAIDRGALRADLDPKFFTFALLGIFNWSFRWYRPGKPITPQEMGPMLFAMLIEGGRNPGASDKHIRPIAE